MVAIHPGEFQQNLRVDFGQAKTGVKSLNLCTKEKFFKNLPYAIFLYERDFILQSNKFTFSKIFPLRKSIDIVFKHRSYLWQMWMLLPNFHMAR